MDVVARRKRVVDDVFSATGAKMEPDDPLVIAALYYSYEMRLAGDVVAGQLQAAAAELRSAADSDSKDRTKILRDIEAHVAKCAKAAGQGRASPPPLGYVPTWYAVVGAVMGAVALSAAMLVGIERGSAQAQDAAVGRSFARVVPTLDPKLKQQLMEHLRKNPG